MLFCCLSSRNVLLRETTLSSFDFFLSFLHSFYLCVIFLSDIFLLLLHYYVFEVETTNVWVGTQMTIWKQLIIYLLIEIFENQMKILFSSKKMFYWSIFLPRKSLKHEISSCAKMKYKFQKSQNEIRVLFKFQFKSLHSKYLSLDVLLIRF